MGAFSGALGSMWVEVGAKIEKFEAGMREVSKNIDSTIGNAQKQFAGFDKIGDSLRGVGTSLTAALTLPLAGIGIASTKMATDFQSAMNKVSALGGATGKELKTLEEAALQWGARTKFSATEAAQGMAELSASGLKTADVLTSMEGVLNLAAAGELKISEAAAIATNAISQFGLSAKDTTHIADVLATAAADSKDSVQGLGVALTYVGGPAKAAGLSMEQTVSALVALSDAGLKSERSGTSLRGILESLSKPTKEAQEAFAALGVKITDAAGKLLPPMEIIDRLKGKTIDLGSASAIAGTVGSTGLIALASKGGAALATFSDKLVHVTGSSKTMAETIQQGLRGALEKAKGSIETAAITIGLALAPSIVKLAGVVESAANKIGEFAKWFETLPDGVKTTALAIAAFAAAIGPALVVAGTLVGSITSLYTGFGLLAGAGGVVGLASKALVAFQGVVAAITLTTAAWTLGITAAVAGLAILGKAIYDNVRAHQDLEDANKDGATALKKLEKHLTDSGVELSTYKAELKSGTITQREYAKELQRLGKELGDNRKATGQIKDETKKNTVEQNAAKEAAARLAAAMKQQMDSLKGVGGAMADLGDVQTPKVIKRFELLDEIARQLNAEHQRSVSAVAKHTIELQNLGDMTGVLTKATAEFKGALGSIPGEMKKISDMAEPFGRDIANAIGFGIPAIEKLDDRIEESVSNTSTSIDEGLSKSKGSWDTWSKQVSTIVTDLGRDLSGLLFDGDKSWAEKGKAALSAIGQAVTRVFVEPATKAIADFVSGALSDLIGGKGLGGVVDRIKGIGDGLKGIFGASGNAAGSVAGQAGGAAGGVGGAAGGIGGAAGNSASAITSAVTGVVSAISDIFGNFQTAAMNKSLDIIVKHTLQTANDLSNLRADEWTRETHLFNKLDDLWNSIREVTAAVEYCQTPLERLAASIPHYQNRFDEISNNTQWGSAADKDNTSFLTQVRDLFSGIASRQPIITVTINGVAVPSSAIQAKLQGLLV